ncbi:hypothetical protein B0H13DRAFT_1862202 [Mycena leptocephala]|nr:hypothetical protein B0H13DRAFT_1862202 [Mycena leptocephala]
MTNKSKYSKKWLKKSLVLRTWAMVLKDEDRLSDDWTREAGFYISAGGCPARLKDCGPWHGLVYGFMMLISKAMQRNPLERVVEAEKSFAGMHVRIAAEDMVGRVSAELINQPNIGYIIPPICLVRRIAPVEPCKSCNAKTMISRSLFLKSPNAMAFGRKFAISSENTGWDVREPSAEIRRSLKSFEPSGH